MRVDLTRIRTTFRVVFSALPDILIHTIPYPGLKRSYSVILFFSFVAGAMQPFLPALEYYFFKEHIIEHHCVNKDNPDVECDGLCYLNKRIDEASHGHDDLAFSSHVKYYPGAVLNSAGAPLLIFPDTRHLNDSGQSWIPLQGTDRPPVPPPRLPE